MHTIRLRAAWKPDTQPTGDQLPEPQQCVAYRRRFHRPTGIEGETVWLATDRLPKESLINGQPLEWDTKSCRADVTTLLLASNELCFQVNEAADLESVRLEIEA